MNLIILAVALYFISLFTFAVISRRFWPSVTSWYRSCEEICFAMVLVGLMLTVVGGMFVASEVARGLPKATTTDLITLAKLGADDVKPGSFVLHHVNPRMQNYYLVNSLRSSGGYKFDSIRDDSSVVVIETDNLKDQGFVLVTCTFPDPSASLAFWASIADSDKVCKREIRIPRGTLETRMTAK